MINEIITSFSVYHPEQYILDLAVRKFTKAG